MTLGRLFTILGSLCALAPCVFSFVLKQSSVVPHSRVRQSSASTAEPAKQTPTLALLTFDLDDTLFPIGPVVEDANEAMVKAMHSLGYKKSTNKSILQHTKKIRKSIRIPISYTDLRMKAIQQELETYQENVHHSVVKYCFDAWLNERQRSANRNLYQGAVSMLEGLSERHPFACIGAITNGRGDPRGMESVAHFFDFCVSGEDDGVFPERKPNRGIYDASLAVYQERYPHPIGESRVWIHVGDCLANDVGGSADCGAYAVWKSPEQEASSPSGLDAPDTQPKWSTASKRTIEKRKRLADKARCKISAEISSLSELPSVVDRILEKAAATDGVAA